MSKNQTGKKNIHIIPSNLGLGILMLAMLLAEASVIMLLVAIDVLPVKYMLLLLVVLAFLDVAAIYLINDRAPHKWKRVTGGVLCGLLLAVMCTGIFYLCSTYDTLYKITGIYEGTTKVTTEPFNVLVSGIDSRDDINDNSARSDVNMIVTVNPQTQTILLTSMPRDSYIPLHMNGEMDKLTHTGVYGIEETIATVEDWMQVDIDYYVRVDFHMLVNLVNAVHGITVYNDIDFESSVKGWHYKKGKISMTGRQALWFVRERKSFEDEDEQRIRNQQKVMKALIEKMTSKKTLLLNYPQILNAVEDNLQTNMSRNEMTSLVKMQLDIMPEWTIKRQWVDGVDAYRGTWSMGPKRELFVSLPKPKSVAKCRKAIQDVMYPEEEK